MPHKRKQNILALLAEKELWNAADNMEGWAGKHLYQHNDGAQSNPTDLPDQLELLHVVHHKPLLLSSIPEFALSLQANLLAHPNTPRVA